MLLVDTQYIIWLAQDSTEVTERAATAMRESRVQGTNLAIASISLFEIALLSVKGRLKFDPSVDVFLERVERAYTVLPLTRHIALRAATFSKRFPKDPADRQIAATAILHGLTLISSDKQIRESGEVPCIW